MGTTSRNNLEHFVATHRARTEYRALEEYSNVPYDVLFMEALEDVSRMNDADLLEEANAWKE